MLAIQQGKTLYLCVQITIKIAIAGKIIIVRGSFIDFQRKFIIYFHAQHKYSQLEGKLTLEFYNLSFNTLLQQVIKLSK